MYIIHILKLKGVQRRNKNCSYFEVGYDYVNVDTSTYYAIIFLFCIIEIKNKY